ncbi:MAG: lysostaphin resistance A-like protein [Candidatus Hodarchaeota archaeon]
MAELPESKEISIWRIEHALLVWAVVLIIIVSFSFVHSHSIWLGVIVTEFTILLVTIVAATRFFGASYSNLGVKRISYKWIILALVSAIAAIGLGFAGVGIQILILGAPPESYLQYLDLLAPRDIASLTTWILLSFFVIAPCEEIFSRGFVQKGLENSLGENSGLILASILFGILHIEFFRIFPTILEGLVIGIVYLKSGHNVIASTISHGFLNSMIFVLVYFTYIPIV